MVRAKTTYIFLGSSSVCIPVIYGVRTSRYVKVALSLGVPI